MEVHTDASVVLNSTDSLPFEFSQFSHRVIVATMILIVSLVGTFGNSLVILAVLLSMKIRTATNAFVVNLATADLLACLAVLFDAAALLAKDGLPFSELLCSVCAVVENVSIGCSILSLASIAFNRLLLVTRPAIIYRKVYTPKNIAMLLALTWLIPLFLTLLPSFLNLGDFKYDPKYHMCGSSASHPRSKAFRILVAGVLYPSLLVSIIVCYVLIWRHLRRHTKMISYTREEPLEPITYTAPPLRQLP
ncbi:melatonin receptor type 1B-A-like [Acanthaster planci]|uniref:Melatonin receptor type 1B-A-like n=1 Tax=Acanthaster planci TaxID=133434 RepID=A0A8B8A357_ACAPL|nr:melatonin receptor type 1B-A-like [Acanthaster planci]